MGGARCLAPSTAPLARAMPLPAPAHAVGRGRRGNRVRGTASRGRMQGRQLVPALSNSRQTCSLRGGEPRPIWMPHPTHHPSPQARSHKAKRLQVTWPGIPDIAVLLDGSVGWVPLPAVATGTELRRHTALVLGRGRGQRGALLDTMLCLATVSDSQGSRAGPHAAPSPTYQPHGAWRADAAPCAAWRAGVLSPWTVAGEEAGTGGVDKLTRAECPLRGAAASSAVPQAPLLADTTKVKVGRG